MMHEGARTLQKKEQKCVTECYEVLVKNPTVQLLRIVNGERKITHKQNPRLQILIDKFSDIRAMQRTLHNHIESEKKKKAE